MSVNMRILKESVEPKRAHCEVAIFGPPMAPPSPPRLFERIHVCSGFAVWLSYRQVASAGPLIPRV